MPNAVGLGGQRFPAGLLDCPSDCFVLRLRLRRGLALSGIAVLADLLASFTPVDLAGLVVACLDRELTGFALLARRVNVGGMSFLQATLQPGRRRSKDVKPIAKAESCQAVHVGCLISGRLHGVMDDGTELDLKPGDFYSIPPGHDA